MNRFLYPLMVVLAFASIISCQEKEPDTIPVEAVAISQSTAEMVIGDHIQLKALVSPSNATEKDVIWSSSNQRVATVSENGYVEALAKGTSNISALVGGLTAICRVSVSEVTIESLTLNKQSLQLYLGQSETLVATIKPDYTTDKTIKWSSADPTIATVEDGVIMALSVGETVIKAKSGEITAECIVIVKTKTVESVKLNKDSIYILEGETETLEVTVLPDDATDKTVHWYSSNTSIATVSADGVVHALHIGNAVITAYCGDKSASCDVMVHWQQVEEVSLNKSSLNLIVGENEDLVATIHPDNCTFKEIIWDSSNHNIAEVDNGMVYAVGEGEATIYAMAPIYDELYRVVDYIVAECHVSVSIIAVESISLNKQEVELVVGDTELLTASVSPSNATYNSVIWNSSDNTVVTVNDGLLSALNTGEAIITATAGGVSASCHVKVIVILADEILLNYETLELKKGDQIELTASVNPDNVTDKTYYWYTSNSSVATVTQDGLVQAKSGGKAIISYFCAGKTAECSVTVSDTGGLCFEGIESGNVEIINPLSRKFRYSYNGIDWETDSRAAFSIALNAGEQLYISGVTNTYANASYRTNIICHGKCYVYGNIMSLLGDSYESLTTIGNYAFCGLFEGNTKITNHPDKRLSLPATTIGDYGYARLFYGCTGLTVAPELPAVVLGNFCYQNMFALCTGLSSAPSLPATTLANYCYSHMFDGCSGLKSTPSLPAKQLANSCYTGMFQNCISLTDMPALPASSLSDYCYCSMFEGCSSLANTMDLPALTLAPSCYQNMFKSCVALSTAPTLPATTLSNYCYSHMFDNCSNLNNAPNLPATTLANYCYEGMFYNCTSLVKAPELPATRLYSSCYSLLFYGCSKLNHIKAMFTTTPSRSYTTNWVMGVAAKGTFVKNSSAAWNVTGDDGIPSGWTVETTDK